MCCRCCQRCWEDFYWNCIEEKFCYDESIANYDPDNDDYYKKKSFNDNGFLVPNRSENNNTPIMVQPSRNQRENTHCSAKIHEDDYRAIQQNGPILAPEILAVFANSQIFNDHPSTKEPKPSPPIEKQSEQNVGEKPTSQLTDNNKSPIRDIDSEKLLIDVEGESHKNKQFNEMTDTKPEQSELVLNPSTIDELDTGGGDDVTKVKLRSIKSAPYLQNLMKLDRPVSDFDIFCITDSISRIGMTPEVPSVSFSALPKNYIDTPTIDEYKEAISLQSIQDANSHKIDTGFDYTNPRYFQRLNSQQSHSADDVSSPKGTSPTRVVEKSKRLKALRNNLPPLRIANAKERLSKTLSVSSNK